MMLLKPFNPSRIPKWLPILVLIVALIGFADATYLTVKHYQNEIPPCTIEGCETVLSSAYAKVAGIPVSLGGSIFYFAIVLLSFLYLDSKKEIFIRLASYLSICGFLASLWFLYLQIFVIKALCQYCLLSAGTSFIIFGVSLWLWLKQRSQVQELSS